MSCPLERDRKNLRMYSDDDLRGVMRNHENQPQFRSPSYWDAGAEVSAITWPYIVGYKAAVRQEARRRGLLTS